MAAGLGSVGSHLVCTLGHFSFDPVVGFLQLADSLCFAVFIVVFSGRPRLLLQDAVFHGAS